MKKNIITKNELKNIIFFLLLLIPFFPVQYLYYLINSYDTIINIYLVLSFLIIFYLFIKDKKINSFDLYLFGFCIFLFSSSIINAAPLAGAIRNILLVLGMCLLIDYGIKTNKKSLIISMSLILCTLVIINLFTILLYPTGMYINQTGHNMNYFLGYKNTHILYIIPAILFSFLYSYIYYDKLKLINYLFIIICLISTLLVQNSTGIVGMSIIIFMIFFKKIKGNICNIYSYLMFHVILFMMIVIMRIQHIFSFIIVDILHKDITFTGRAYIWNNAIEVIKEKPLIGYGDVSFIYSDSVYSTHNAILGILHKIGFIGLILYLIFLFKSIKPLYENRTNKIAKFVSIIFLVYLVMMITEFYNFEYYLFICVVAYNVKYLIGE